MDWLVRKKGSGALPSLMLDLGLLEISLGVFFPLFLATASGSSNPAARKESNKEKDMAEKS